MAKEKGENNDRKEEGCTGVFKNGALTKEDYTHIWIELITALERRKSANLSSGQ
ncbi:MAG: hypothetical protein IJW71_00115 [Clostridia bacterium]|nr:hypothetical protein [Clostridia bacterium]